MHHGTSMTHSSNNTSCQQPCACYMSATQATYVLCNHALVLCSTSILLHQPPCLVLAPITAHLHDFLGRLATYSQVLPSGTLFWPSMQPKPQLCDQTQIHQKVMQDMVATQLHEYIRTCTSCFAACSSQHSCEVATHGVTWTCECRSRR